jgi:hypothetical protein
MVSVKARRQTAEAEEADGRGRRQARVACARLLMPSLKFSGARF